MNDSLQDAIKEAFAIAPSNKVILYTLEIRQEGVQDPIFLVRSLRSIDAYDENGVLHTFEPIGFDFSLPPSTDEGYQHLNIAIDNVGRRVIDFIEAAKASVEPVQIIFRPYMSDDLSSPQMDPPLVLYLKDVTITAAQVVGRATFADIVNKKFPSQLYIRERFPSLG